MIYKLSARYEAVKKLPSIQAYKESILRVQLSGLSAMLSFRRLDLLLRIPTRSGDSYASLLVYLLGW